MTRPLARAGFFVGARRIPADLLLISYSFPTRFCSISWLAPAAIADLAKCARAQIGANQGGTGRIAAR